MLEVKAAKGHPSRQTRGDGPVTFLQIKPCTALTCTCCGAPISDTRQALIFSRKLERRFSQDKPHVRAVCAAVERMEVMKGNIGGSVAATRFLATVGDHADVDIEEGPTLYL